MSFVTNPWWLDDKVILYSCSVKYGLQKVDSQARKREMIFTILPDEGKLLL